MQRERVSRLPKAPSDARPGLDAGATGALHCAALEGGRTTPQQSAAACGCQGSCHGQGAPLPRLAVRGQEHASAPGARPHTARPAKDQSTYSLERSEPQSPLVEGEGG